MLFELGSGIGSSFGLFFGSSNSLNSNFSVQSREGTSSSSSSNHYASQKKRDNFCERVSILNSQIEGIEIGIEPIGSRAMHKIVNNKFIGTLRKFALPTYLGGGTFCHHLSCLLKIRERGLFGTEEHIILEYGGYFGDEPDYKNYVHYWKEDGLRFSLMSETDYSKKIREAGEGSDDLFVLFENKMTVQQLITKCCSEGNWRAYDYNVASNNCQDFIAKVIDILGVKRKYSYTRKITNIPPCIMKALEKNEGRKVLRVFQKIPLLGNFVELGSNIAESFKEANDFINGDMEYFQHCFLKDFKQYKQSNQYDHRNKYFNFNNFNNYNNTYI